MKQKKVMLLGNHAFVIYNFRKELIQKLLKDGYEVYLSMPYDDDKVPKMIKWGCKFIETNVDRRGTNPIKDLNLIKHYLQILKRHKPDIVLTYTIKPNLYGGIACSLLKIPYLTNITGLGSGFKKPNILKKMLVMLYKLGLKKSSKIFFQNTNDERILLTNGIVKSDYEVIPGSGVNLTEYTLKPLPSIDEIRFIFVGRIMKDKGIEEYLNAARIVKKNHGVKVRFDVVGFIESTEKGLINKINSYDEQGIINYLGYQANVKPFIEDVHCLIQPSHGGEGISNVLLEAGAMGRVLIASDIPGCKETIEVNKSGYTFEAKNYTDLAKKIDSFLLTSTSNSIQEMSKNSREKIKNQFNRSIVVKKYISAIKKHS